MDRFLGWTVGVFLVSAAVGVFAAVTKRPRLLAIFKPLTTLLLLAVVGWPRTSFAWLIDAGIVFSLVGDVALLSSAKKAFLLGLASFFVAHGLYIAAFARAFVKALSRGATGWAVPSAMVAVVMIVVTVLLLRRLWAGAAGLRAPLVGYATALLAMALAAYAAVVAQAISPLATLGAFLFYGADASLALDRFAKPIKNAPLLTLGVYWLGQLGIALAARLLTA